MTEDNEFTGIKVNYNDAYRAMAYVVSEVGRGYVYRGECVYVIPEDGGEWSDGPMTGEWEPACIVGRVLVHLGVPARLLRGLGALADVRSEFEMRGISFTDRAYAFLDNAQYFQDRRISWSDSRDMAAGLVSRHTWDLNETLVHLGTRR